MILRKLFMVIIVLLVAGGAYFWWSKRQSSSETPLVSTPFTDEINAKLEEYRKIESISPNLNIFDDKLFQALHPGGVSLPLLGSGGLDTTAGTRGRPNPFIAF